MRCGRCGGSVIDFWEEAPGGQKQVPKCISCGRENKEGEMGEEKKCAECGQTKKSF